jgi:hypothetical protein
MASRRPTDSLRPVEEVGTRPAVTVLAGFRPEATAPVVRTLLAADPDLLLVRHASDTPPASSLRGHLASVGTGRGGSRGPFASPSRSEPRRRDPVHGTTTVGPHDTGRTTRMHTS